MQLRTERLLLRKFRADDIDAHAELCADPEVTRFLRSIRVAQRLGSREAGRATVHGIEHLVYRLDARPRVTGDGYDEAVVADADGNRIDLVE